MLNDTRVRNAKGGDRPIKLSDSGGLHVLIQPTGSKLWRLAYRFDGKQKTLALGVYRQCLLRRREGTETKRRSCWLAPSILRWNAGPTNRQGKTAAFEPSLRK